jgi:hypothetical protein
VGWEDAADGIYLKISIATERRVMSNEERTTPSGPKKRFIGKARAEALRRKAAEQGSTPNIEDGVVLSKSILKSRSIKVGTPPRGGRIANQIPEDILHDEALNEAIKIVALCLDALTVASFQL